MKINYKSEGFNSREDCLHYLADIHDLPYWLVESTANNLDDENTYSDLVTICERYEYEKDEYFRES